MDLYLGDSFSQFIIFRRDFLKIFKYENRWLFFRKTNPAGFTAPKHSQAQLLPQNVPNWALSAGNCCWTSVENPARVKDTCVMHAEFLQRYTYDGNGQ